MNRINDEVGTLQKQANAQPASYVAPFWFIIWIIISCMLLWLFSAQAFPEYGQAQGVSLLWVGALITAGGVIAAACCYKRYKTLLDCKRSAINKLKEQNLNTGQSMSQSTAQSINIVESILTLAVAIVGLGIVAYLLQSFV